MQIETRAARQYIKNGDAVRSDDLRKDHKTLLHFRPLHPTSGPAQAELGRGTLSVNSNTRPNHLLPCRNAKHLSLLADSVRY
jgi:hypothetical protein